MISKSEPQFDPARMRELSEKWKAEHPDMFNGNPAMRELWGKLDAKRVMVEENYPEHLRAYRERERRDARDRRARRHGMWGFPRHASELIISASMGESTNDMGAPVITTEAEKWLAGACCTGKKVMCLLGTMGSGKTTAACRVVDQQIRAWDEVIFPDAMYATAAEFIDKSYRRSAESDDWFRKISDADWLILDELGTNSESADHSSRLATFLREKRIDARVSATDNGRQIKRTICIGNIPEAEFYSRYGAALESRMGDCGIAHVCTEVVRRGEMLRIERGTTVSVQDKGRKL